MNADTRFWDNIAEKYAAKPVDDVPAFERKKAITKARLREDQTIFEIGCGTGTLALELSASVAHVHAMDVSSEMIRIANDKKAAHGVENVTFHQGTLDGTTPFEPGQFAGVCAYSILHLVDDRPNTLQTIYELLSPGGFFISSTVCLGSSWVPYGLILPVMRWVGKAPHVDIIDHATLLREIGDAGFADIEKHDVGSGPTNAFIEATKPP